MRVILTVFLLAAVSLTGCGPTSKQKPSKARNFDAFAQRVLENAIEPRMTRDGRGLVYTSYIRGKDLMAEIWYLERATGRVVQLTQNSWSDGQATLSPDGNLVIFTSQRQDGRNLWMVNRLTRELFQVTERGGSYADWHPSENVILFTEQRLEREDIVAMDLKSGLKRSLVESPANDSHGRWSPDGRFVVFSSDRGGTDGIYVSEVRTGKVWTVVDLPGHERFPTWSPDGNAILFSSDYWPIERGENEHGARVNLWYVEVRGGSPVRMAEMLYQNTLYDTKAVHADWSASGPYAVVATNATALAWEVLELDVARLLEVNRAAPE